MAKRAKYCTHAILTVSLQSGRYTTDMGGTRIVVANVKFPGTAPAAPLCGAARSHTEWTSCRLALVARER